MGVKYLRDTNTAIYYLQQQFPSSAEQFIDSTLSDSGPAISAIRACLKILGLPL